jgi:hypothetical protein
LSGLAVVLPEEVEPTTLSLTAAGAFVLVSTFLNSPSFHS